MIQRIQTLYLLAGIIALIACLLLPVGQYQPEGMGVGAKLFNLMIQSENPALQLSIWQQSFPLFLCVFLAVLLTLVAIFSYKTRKRQARLCVSAIVCCLLWYVGVYFYGFYLCPIEWTFRPGIGICLPLLSAFFFYLARNGVLADERLVRESNRLR